MVVCPSNPSEPLKSLEPLITLNNMYRKQTCGELRLANVGQEVTLAGWVQRVRKMGGLTFVDIRDRYGITQLVFDESEADAALCDKATHLGREYVIQVIGIVRERESKNRNIPTGEVEIVAKELNIISTSEVPPFTIEDKTDGGDDLRMQYRYLDLRRPMVRKNLELRHRTSWRWRPRCSSNRLPRAHATSWFPLA